MCAPATHDRRQFDAVKTNEQGPCFKLGIMEPERPKGRMQAEEH